MKIAFKEISEKLNDPFFELRYLGKDMIRQQTLPSDKFGDASVNFQIIEWMQEDNDEIIEYYFYETEIGKVLIGNTSKGICFLGLAGGDEEKIKQDFFRRFPKQNFKLQMIDFQRLAVDYCNGKKDESIPLHLKGTSFQVAIWKKLLCIPEGKLTTYGSLLDDSKAAQAVGSAVGANPVSYIIPCHRVVKNDGDFKGYHWGTDLKKQLLAYELQNGL
ncbi:methylated-DNA--[protein]-cysteine S-methyltransferase [Paludibacteraceae bacterium OttesenSCG-928-F17]|nr:methylated-DNA--[protein]-cysteine S-methyltransferase [Paludibacteraceae bacterium OttesenSCG-928-F17]